MFFNPLVVVLDILLIFTSQLQSICITTVLTLIPGIYTSSCLIFQVSGKFSEGSDGLIVRRNMTSKFLPGLAKVEPPIRREGVQLSKTKFTAVDEFSTKDGSVMKSFKDSSVRRSLQGGERNGR